MAFQSLQLVVTDFLPLMPGTCIKVVVDVAGKFGLQPQELNISLTAIGLLVSNHVTILFVCLKGTNMRLLFRRFSGIFPIFSRNTERRFAPSWNKPRVP